MIFSLVTNYNRAKNLDLKEKFDQVNLKLMKVCTARKKD